MKKNIKIKNGGESYKLSFSRYLQWIFLLQLLFIYNLAFSISRSSAVISDSFTYKITLKTGYVIGAGTDARIFCRLSGHGMASSETLLFIKGVDLFEPGSSDIFYIKTSGDLVDIQAVIIRFDDINKNPDDNWFLEGCQIENLLTGDKRYFLCNFWVNATNGGALLGGNLVGPSGKYDVAMKPELPEYYYFENLTLASIKSKLTSQHSLNNAFTKDGRIGLKEGSVIVYNTDKNHYGKMIISGYFVKSFYISWVTYLNNGNIFSQGDLRVGENDFIDVDAGVIEKESGDFQFKVLSNARMLECV